MTFLVILVLILIGFALLPMLFERRRLPIDRVYRSQAPGKFAELSAGVTHYRWAGPVRGPVAVLIHGQSTSSPMWEETAAVLADVGYRILMYDLYNRGFSDNVEGQHDVQLYLTQLDELLADQGLDEGVTLVGYSMGGIVATEFAATEPHRMRRLILLAPGGVIMKDSRFAKFTRDTPIIGDWLNGLLSGIRLRNQIKDDDAATLKPHIRKARLMELERKGYLSGVLACRRGVMLHTQERQHRAIARDGISTVVIWGEDDRVVPVAAVGQLAQWNRRALHEVIPGAGHELPYSHIEQVNEKLRTLLRDSN